MHNTVFLLVTLVAASVLAQPVDLQKEAATVDARIVGKRTVAPISTEARNYKLDWAHAANCAIDNFPGCISDDDGTSNTEQESPKTGTERRWVDPPSTVPTGFGTECSLDTCYMCPSFPGCTDDDAKAGKVSALQKWAQPPLKVRDESANEPIVVKENWEQPPREAKREAYINPIVAGGVNIGLGPECSIRTCDMCPEYPGCENVGSEVPPMV